ncbi:MAG TPA: hypothetical protein VGO91_19755 [Pyrinomonadaceae bacterium]|nr:hypothetical protein [Pyrinomonadaceae bacterium]
MESAPGTSAAGASLAGDFTEPAMLAVPCQDAWALGRRELMMKHNSPTVTSETSTGSIKRRSFFIAARTPRELTERRNCAREVMERLLMLWE